MADSRLDLLQGTLDMLLLKALQEERLQDARAEFDAVLAVDEGHAAARKGVTAVQTAFARRWFNTAQRLEEEGKLGNALLAYVRANQEKVGATPALERAEVVRRKLQDEVAFLVVTGPAEDKAEAPDVAQAQKGHEDEKGDTRQKVEELPADEVEGRKPEPLGHRRPARHQEHEPRDHEGGERRQDEPVDGAPPIAENRAFDPGHLSSSRFEAG